VEGKAAYDSIGEVEKFVIEFEKANQSTMGQQPQQTNEEPFEVHTIKIE
jgi:hypothetical protein